uniref:Thiamine-monophosphate kinase n=1 Tax=Candidatus Methanophaga sp. ANME-1 ERB7 TaxID=2759913 RepID=A0A7G9ZCE9_9EURY|nr:thiamine-monophosphate kinase [Methanosarcinales archaeon ANME-1 ERB7]
MDLEGFAKRELREGEADSRIIAELCNRIVEIKQDRITKEKAEEISNAVLEESKITLDYNDELITELKSDVRMGELGVGSRGAGDFYAHEKIGELIGATGAVVDSSSLSDSGVVRLPEGSKEKLIVVTVDGMHSRLSDFPFLAGFHVARAALRDVYVMGATPVALLSDIHVADDGDVAKIFDHIAGISAVSDAAGVPLVTGSTLRIGGDVVIGERMTGCVGAVGVADRVVTREGAREEDVILMSEGAGGGTITTAALYYGEPEVVQETMNIKFLNACNMLIKEEMEKKVHLMTDVTNGGIRGDANEIAKVSHVKLVFHEDRIRDLVNKKVLAMLQRREIDYLGISLDALLVICPAEVAEAVKAVVRSAGVRIEEIGSVVKGNGAEIVVDGENKDFVPKFRESAYTPIKKVVGESGGDFEAMKRKVDKAVEEAVRKKDKVKRILESS